MKTFLRDMLALATAGALAVLSENSLAQDKPQPPLSEVVSAQSDPQPLSLEKLAEKAFLENSFRESAQFYTRAIRMDPRRSSLYVGRAQALEMIQLPKKAVEDYERALELDPDNYRAMEGLAGMLEREGKQIERAVALYEQALSRDPRSEWKENLAVWIRMLESRLRPVDSYPAALWREGNKKALDGKASEAEMLYTKAVALDPLFYHAYFRRAQVRIAQEDMNGALNDLNAAVELSPELRGALLQRGLIHERLGNGDQAMDDFKRASEIDSRDPYAHYHLGRLSETTGLYVEALYAYKNALELKPKPELRSLLTLRMAVVAGPARPALQERSGIRKMLKDLW
ncbi:MAG: tetratricopeptide repeat protein [Pseudomonadota bacterium]